MFLTVLLAMFIFALLRQYRFRLKEYEWQLAREVELIDAERKRIHIDLHDEIGAGLASIGILMQQEPTKDSIIHEKISKQVQDMRIKIKEIAYNFIPPTLESLGLKATIIELLEEINAGHQIKTKSELHFEDSKFLAQKSVHIYRIIKEILTNALKHSSCSSIYCTLKCQEKYLTLLIGDNGIGIRASDNKWMTKGAGVSHIQSRVKLLHASINILSSPGKGINYEIQIPLDSLQNENIYGK